MHDIDQAVLNDLLHQYHRRRSSDTREKIIKLLLPLVNTIAHRFQSRGESLDDIVQIGTIGLLKALDYEHKTPKHHFIPYVISMIIGEIKHYFRDSFNNIRIPRKYLEASKEINSYIQEYAQEHKGLKPTIKEIAKGKHLKEALILETYEAISFSYRPRNQETEENKFYSTEQTNFTNRIDQILCIESAMQHLSPREQKMIHLYFLRSATQREIAKLFHISQAQVVRVISRALEQCKIRLGKENNPTVVR
jgi:RNA polymerase sigma-B factor